jgi:hypothetical protein
MRWEALFDDFEAQLAEAGRAGLEAEVRELVWAEQAGLSLDERLRGPEGAIDVLLRGGLRFRGEVREVAQGWFSLDAAPRSVLVPLPAVIAVSGMGRRSRREIAHVRRALSLGSALRALARARAQVVCHMGHEAADPLALAGTIDAVGKDYAELAPVRAEGWGRQPSAGTTAVPFGALIAVVSPR